MSKLLRQIREQAEARQRAMARPPREPLTGLGGTDPETLVWMEFQLVTLKDEYMICKQWDGSAVFGDATNVARDPELRKSTYDGETINHGGTIGQLSYAYTGPKARTVTKTSDSSEQDQIIIPDLVESRSIISVVPAAVAVLDDDGATVVWCQWREFTQRAWANVED